MKRAFVLVAALLLSGAATAAEQKTGGLLGSTITTNSPHPMVQNSASYTVATFRDDGTVIVYWNNAERAAATNDPTSWIAKLMIAIRDHTYHEPQK